MHPRLIQPSESRSFPPLWPSGFVQPNPPCSAQPPRSDQRQVCWMFKWETHLPNRIGLSSPFAGGLLCPPTPYMIHLMGIEVTESLVIGGLERAVLQAFPGFWIYMCEYLQHVRVSKFKRGSLIFTSNRNYQKRANKSASSGTQLLAPPRSSLKCLGDGPPGRRGLGALKGLLA